MTIDPNKLENQPDPNAPSVQGNLPVENLVAPAPPEPLSGEVKAGAAHPDQEDAVSVLANKPEDVEPLVIPPIEGEVPAGSNEPGVAPPSVQGTSYEPDAPQPPDPEPETEPETPVRKRKGMFT